MNLHDLANKLRHSAGIVQKQDIQATARSLGLAGTPIRVGDDCAAIPDGEEYLLLAAEGMWHVLVDSDPWFAGWCAVMVNLSDIAAIGGRAIAIVDVIWSQTAAASEKLMQGLKAASQVYNIPIVGGHTNLSSDYNALSVAVLGRSRRLITSFDAQRGDRLLMAVDLRGKFHDRHPFWNAATDADPQRLRDDLEVLPNLANQGLCDAGKDISMGGIVGTLLMLMETSGRGAVLNLDSIPRPEGVSWETWLLCFPSYGFILSVRPENVAAVKAQFSDRQIACEVVGTVQAEAQVWLQFQNQTVQLWDFKEQLTGFAP